MKYSPIFLGATLLCSSAVIACSSDDGDGNGSTGSSGSGDSSTAGDTESGSTTNGDTDSDSSTSGNSTTSGASTSGDTGEPDEDNSACGLADGNDSFFGTADINDVEGLDECGGETREVESVAADIFILLDKSSSMGEHKVSEADDAPTRWEALTESLKEFFVAEDSQNLRVGIQYFGLAPTEDSELVDESGVTSCDPLEYAVPDVEIDVLSENSGDLVDSIDDHFPDAFTPTHPALAGALSYAKQSAEETGRATVLVLATDGYPTVCDDTSISGLEDLVQAYANPTDDSPSIPTFVLGVGEVSNLERVAVKGGTGRAFFVADCPTATEDLLAALKRVANSAAACEFELPEPNVGGQEVDCGKVNVIYQQNGSDVTQGIPHVDSEADCTSGGWYYEETESSSCTPGETKIRICPSSCRNLGGGSVRLVVGCDPIELD